MSLKVSTILAFARYVRIVNADASWSHRRVRVVVQHLLAPKAPPPAAVQPIAPMASVSELASPRIASSGLSTPTAATATQTFNYELARQKLLVASPAGSQAGDAGEPTEGVALPPPYASESRRDSSVVYCGPSAVYLAPMVLRLDNESVPGERLAYAEQDFDLTFVPTKRGFSTVGALRVLVVERHAPHERVPRLLPPLLAHARAPEHEPRLCM